MKLSVIILSLTFIPSLTAKSLSHASQSQIAAATLILEAGGERAPRAMESVYEVLRNRAELRGISVRDVCLQPLQFSCWNGDRDSALARAMNHPRWSEALEIVKSPRTSFTSGADHYHTKSVNPKWNRRMTRTVVIGNHIFFKS